MGPTDGGPEWLRGPARKKGLRHLPWPPLKLGIKRE